VVGIISEIAGSSDHDSRVKHRRHHPPPTCWLPHGLFNVSLELVKDRLCIIQKRLHTLWKQIKGVTMTKEVAEGKVTFQAVQ
jgi:hypothetical protein